MIHSLQQYTLLSSSNSTSNIKNHFRTHHPEVYAATFIEDKVVIPITSKLESTKASPNHLPVDYGPMDNFTNLATPNKTMARQEAKEAIYDCVNDLGFPSDTVEKPKWRNMLNTIHQNAPHLVCWMRIV